MNFDKISWIIAIFLTLLLGMFAKTFGVSLYLVQDILMYLTTIALVILVVITIKEMRDNKKRGKDRTPRQTQMIVMILFMIAAIISTLTGIRAYWFLVPIIIFSALADLIEKKKGAS